MKPICYDLFCGLGGWSDAFLAEGYRCVGFDIEAHEYLVPDHDTDDGTKNAGGSWFNIGSPGQKVTNQNPVHRLQAKQGTKLLKYPGELILRDVRSIHGSELKDAAIIVASPPCQAYSYRAMPWKRAKALPPPDNELFNACFRIQREAIEAAGHWIPLVVENVRGAQKWVGRARWNYGSFYLWGDVPALMPHTFKREVMKRGVAHRSNGETNFHGSAARARGCHCECWRCKRGGHCVRCDCELNTGRKVSMNFHEHEKTGKPGRSFQSAAVAEMGVKNGNDWFGSGDNCSLQRRARSKSNARKAASAMIAKIPFPLALHIARTYKPQEMLEIA